MREPGVRAAGLAGGLTLLASFGATACGSSSAGPAGSSQDGAVADVTTIPDEASGGEAGGSLEAAAVDDAGLGGPEASASDAPTGGAGCSSTGTLCWGFEEGVTTPPGWTVGRTDFGAVVLANDSTAHTGPALVVDQTRPHAGKYALHARGFVGGTPATQGGPKATIVYALPASFGPVLWGRMFVYTEPSAPMSHAGLFNARYPRPSSPTSTATSTLDWYEVASYTQKYMTVWHPPEPPGYPEDVQVSGTSVVLGQWACLEWLFDGSAGDAGQASAPRMWVDGAELTWPNEFTYPDAATPNPREPVGSFRMLETGVYLYQGLTTATDWWIDDLAVGPQRIGCSG